MSHTQRQWTNYLEHKHVFSRKTWARIWSQGKGGSLNEFHMLDSQSSWMWSKMQLLHTSGSFVTFFWSSSFFLDSSHLASGQCLLWQFLFGNDQLHKGMWRQLHLRQVFLFLQKNFNRFVNRFKFFILWKHSLLIL